MKFLSKKREETLIFMWYEKYGWDSNPFFVKYDLKLVGLEEQKQRLLDYANSGDICVITGDSGVGKTSLLKWIQKNLRKHKIIYLNAESIPEFFSLKRHIKRKNLFNFLGRKVVLLIDEAQNCDESFKRELKAVWDGNLIKSAIIAQTKANLADYEDSFKRRIGDRHIRLKGLDFQKTTELINLRTEKRHPFDEEIINYVFESSDKNPRKILENCELTCIELQDKEMCFENFKKVLEERKAESLLNLVELEESPLPDNLMPINQLDLHRFSPMQKKVVNILYEGSRTVKQLALILNSSEGSVGKQISKLIEMNVATIVNSRRPKVYGLAQGFKEKLH